MPICLGKAEMQNDPDCQNEKKTQPAGESAHRHGRRQSVHGTLWNSQSQSQGNRPQEQKTPQRAGLALKGGGMVTGDGALAVPGAQPDEMSKIGRLSTGAPGCMLTC